MKLPFIHDIRFLSGEFFLRAFRRYGLGDQLMKTGRASASLQLTINEILLGDRSKARETELIERIAEEHIYLASLEIALSARNDVRTAIDSKLAELTDKVLRP